MRCDFFNLILFQGPRSISERNSMGSVGQINSVAETYVSDQDLAEGDIEGEGAVSDDGI